MRGPGALELAFLPRSCLMRVRWHLTDLMSRSMLPIGNPVYPIRETTPEAIASDMEDKSLRSSTHQLETSTVWVWGTPDTPKQCKHRFRMVLEARGATLVVGHTLQRCTKHSLCCGVTLYASAPAFLCNTSHNCNYDITPTRGQDRAACTGVILVASQCSNPGWRSCV